MRTVNIGIIGIGTVGGGVVRLIQKHHDQYIADYGVDLNIAYVCCRTAAKADALGVAGAYTSDWQDIVNDPAVDIVVELIGGMHPASEIYEAAFKAGKHVVTANKALLGKDMEAIAGAAAAAGVQIKCEAAAAGGIPVVNALEHSLVANRILTIAGILNGTTNYMLSRMESEGVSYEAVLADAQRLGYAEADPTADVDGLDAASKTAILASIAFHTRVNADEVFTQGIRSIGVEDIEMAHEMGYTVKLLGVARNTANGIEARVHPTMIPQGHQLAAVSGAMNAVYVVGDAVGETMFYGAGAGAFPTASAVLGDVFSIADHISRGIEPLPETEPYGRVAPVLSIDKLENRFYIRMRIDDRLGALEAAVSLFTKAGISISQVKQLKSDGDGACSVMFITHKASEAAVASLVEACASNDAPEAVREVASVVRIEDIETWVEGALEN